MQLAEDIIAHSAYNSWELNTKTNPQALPISAHREGEVPGIHEIQYSSTSDKISLRHEAFSRKGFALGAIIMEWIIEKKGIFNMEDVLKTFLNAVLPHLLILNSYPMTWTSWFLFFAVVQLLHFAGTWKLYKAVENRLGKQQCPCTTPLWKLSNAPNGGCYSLYSHS